MMLINTTQIKALCRQHNCVATTIGGGVISIHDPYSFWGTGGDTLKLSGTPGSLVDDANQADLAAWLANRESSRAAAKAAGYYPIPI